MVKMNTSSMRERKKLRKQQTSVFSLEVHDIVTQGNDNPMEEIDKIYNKILFNPWYWVSFRRSIG